MLSLVAVGSFLFLGFFQFIRSVVLIRLSEWFDKELYGKFLSLTMNMASLVPGMSGSQAVRDLNVVKQYLTGPGLSALFDAPWGIVFIFVVWMIHPLPGMIALMGGIVLVVLALLNDIAGKEPLSDANEKAMRNFQSLETAVRNAEVIEAMGMEKALMKRWTSENEDVVALQSKASFRSNIISSITKTFRMLLQIGVIASGGYLVLQNELSVGGIIACSILAGRALAPFDQAIGSWNAFSSARKSYSRLTEMLVNVPEKRENISLPAPKGNISVEKLMYAPTNSKTTILKGLTFNLAAGDSLGIVGPSAAGKSTLAKLLVGVWRPVSGAVRLDGADVYNWKRDEFGQYIGYLPQDVELFAGTVRDNIARLAEDATDESVVKAAQLAQAHEMILRLPEGYQTQIGSGGASLSAGQRQRIGLARAFFGDPCFLVLDEPNANLDDQGEIALVRAIQMAKKEGITTLIISHRPNILNFVDYIMVMKEGLVSDFGPSKEIIEKFARQAKEAQAQAAQAKQQQVQQGGGAAPQGS
jgi:PrtD family type I secretion system ABC transporter